MDRAELEKESSLLYWYPKIRGVLPTPRTRIVHLDGVDPWGVLDGEPLDEKLLCRLRSACARIGYPVFLRSDQASGKHQWNETCFVPNEEALFSHVYRLIEWHACAGIMGMDMEAFVVRELLDLESTFKAFRGMPVAKERRYFVRDGEVECWHPYWPEDAFPRYNANLPEDWRERLRRLNAPRPGEVECLTQMAALFGEKNPGWWSVDFAKVATTQSWILIDAARGEVSWHPEECPYSPNHASRVNHGESEPDGSVPARITFEELVS